MFKRAAFKDGERVPKRVRIDDGNCQPSPLADPAAWEILEQYLTTDMTYPQMEETFSAYLGNRYVVDDWKDARDALFSGDDDNSIALANLRALKTSHIPLPLFSSRTDGLLSSAPVQQLRRRPKSRMVGHLSNIRVQRSGRRPKSNPYIISEADEDDEDEDKEEEGERDDLSVQLPKVVRDFGPSAKDRLAARFDTIFDRVEGIAPSSLELRQARHCITIPSSRVIEGRMYLLHVNRNSIDCIAEHLRHQGFHVTVSIWAAGQLYVVADSPRTIAASLPTSHAFAVKQYLRISDEEREAVDGSCSNLPNPAWVRIKYGQYKGDIGYVFDSDQSNGLIAILIPPRCFPYPMPGGSVALFDQFRLPDNQTVSDLIRDGKVVGCSYKGEHYYMGLLLKHFHCDRLELVASPHADDIRLHMQSGFDTPFVKKTLVAFSMQFLRLGDSARVIAGELCSKVGTVVLTDHTSGSVRLEMIFDGHRNEIDVRLEDIEHIFCVGDQVRVVAGPYLGLEGHVIQISDDMFHICQDVSKEEVLVSRYYLDRRPLHYTLQPRLPSLQHFEPPPEPESLQVGDYIEVLAGEHLKKCGIVEWIPVGGTMLWFRDANVILAGDDVESSVVPSRIYVPMTIVQRTKLSNTIKFTKERGYDIRPGDVVSVARGPEYQRKGVVQSVNFPNARLTLLSDSDHSLISLNYLDSSMADLSQVQVPITFVTKNRNVDLDSLNKVIRQEVFIVGGDQKGYRATLYNIAVGIHFWLGL
ncbi:uncharacterized protein HD556DRAFT_1474554 [Suillus plorans]|uniref:KOW domain-containing protein n=1 Tax=Suillus plorans TaxID=116603 RepID=A0A9P7AS30_9AGAM|nr:uncharacterized protein HD556DRAFT_1474554 [Suillus plorans]KAG1794535.1 hypothetical protein HD556DRAFT_1474554 [Suillus plorans]